MFIQKFSIGLLVLGVSAFVQAEELVPLFDDDVPNVGRNATPLNEIHITPPELPDVQMDIGTNKAQAPSRAQSPASQSPGKMTPSNKPSASRRVPIAAATKISDQENNKMAKQLLADMQQAKERKEAAARAEQEAAQQAAREAEEQALQEQQQASQQEPQPSSLTGLFRELHDVHSFDISGFSLGMTPEDAMESAEDSGYMLTKLEHGIPLHRTSFYKENCKLAKIYRVDEIEACVTEQAQNDDMLYISSLTFAKPQTAEFIQVLFTGPDTDNVAYKIYYENEGDNSLGFTRKNLAQKISRRDAFWKMVYDTYGYPDDADTFTWGDPQKASMHAQMQGSNYNAYLILEDKEIHHTDLMDMDETGKELPHHNTFTFSESEDD